MANRPDDRRRPLNQAPEADEMRPAKNPNSAFWRSPAAISWIFLAPAFAIAMLLIVAGLLVWR